MSTSPISSSGLTSSSTINSNGSSLQITGLASGLDTNAIISALLAPQSNHIARLTNQQNTIKSLNSTLTSIQSSLQTMELNAQALGDPGLYAPVQSVTSSNSSLIAASMASGAGVGGYQVSVTSLASSAQRTFTFTSPAAQDTLTIDGHQTTIPANGTIQDFINAVNSDPNATVYAAKTNANTVVLSTRTTGQTTGNNYITVVDSANSIVENAALAKPGQDAKFSVDGVSGSSSTNTVTNAIAGVTLNIGGVTPTGAPVTVTVGAPAPSTSNIEAAVNTFIASYNGIIDQVSRELTTAPSSSNPNIGQLFGDNELTSFLSDMRATVYAGGTDSTGAALPSGFAALSDIGITTGAGSGSGTFSQDSVSGKLTLDKTALENALATNPSGVEAVLQSWASRFSKVVDNVAGPGGGIDTRIQGDTSEISNIGNQITSLNQMLSTRQTTLTAQFAKLEATLSQYQTQSNWLTSQLTSLMLSNTH